MAVRSLTCDYANDPKRSDSGLQAILNTAADPNNGDVAREALRVLVPTYCGRLVPDPATHMFSYTSSGPMPNPRPIPWPVYITRMVNAARTGPIQDRIKIIRQIGASEPRFLAGRWDLFEFLMIDPDPSIRAEAFAAARTVTFKVVAEKRNLRPIAPPPTRPVK